MKRAVTGSAPACHRGMASQLSPRQREILDLVAAGRTSKDIAATLGISESTVNWHLANVFARLGASSRAEAVALSIRSNGNGAERASAPIQSERPPPRPPARIAWRLVAIAIAIAVAGALLGGATVAMFHVGLPPPIEVPTAFPTSSGDRIATPSPESASPAGVGGDPPAAAPSTSLPTITAPPLPSVVAPLGTPAVPTIPVTLPPLPSLPLPTLPLPLPTLPHP